MPLNKLFPVLPGEDEIRGKGVEGKTKPALLPSSLDLMAHPSQVGYNNLVVG